MVNLNIGVKLILLLATTFLSFFAMYQFTLITLRCKKLWQQLIRCLTDTNWIIILNFFLYFYLRLLFYWGFVKLHTIFLCSVHRNHFLNDLVLGGRQIWLVYSIKLLIYIKSFFLCHLVLSKYEIINYVSTPNILFLSRFLFVVTDFRREQIYWFFTFFNFNTFILRWS